mgnify:CR=1 FL=1
MKNANNYQNYKEIENFLCAIWEKGDVRELRLIGKENKKNILYGYFERPEAAAVACFGAQHEKFCYVTLNPVNRQLLAKSEPNRLHAAREGDTTSDNNVSDCVLLLIDCDPIRPAGTSSSEAQISDAEFLSGLVIEKLGKPYIYGMSGNGYHLIYKINKGSKTEERKAFLGKLSSEFRTPLSKIDISVFNPSRITKVLGTWAIKEIGRASCRERV